MDGDEFLVVLLGITAGKGIAYTEELIEKCNEIKLLGVDNAGITPSTAVGIASRNGSYKTFEDMLKEADNNMYEHKRESKFKII